MRHSVEARKRISAGLTRAYAEGRRQPVTGGWKLSAETRSRIGAVHRGRKGNNLPLQPWESLTAAGAKRRLLKEGPPVCEKCGQLPEWNDEPLTLQMDHRDGDRKNNARENLRWLCPNCHSQTDTFCGRNKRR